MEKMLSDVLLENLKTVKATAGTLVWKIEEVDDLVQDLAERVWKNDAPASNFDRPFAYFSKSCAIYGSTNGRKSIAPV